MAKKKPASAPAIVDTNSSKAAIAKKDIAKTNAAQNGFVEGKERKKAKSTKDKKKQRKSL